MYKRQVIEYGEYIFTIETEKTLTKEYVKSKILEFMSQDEIMITKKNKKGKIVEMCIRDRVYSNLVQPLKW